MKNVTVKWSEIAGMIAKIILWILLWLNVLNDKYDVALVYGVIIIAFGISDIADNTKEKDERV